MPYNRRWQAREEQKFFHVDRELNVYHRRRNCAAAKVARLYGTLHLTREEDLTTIKPCLHCVKDK